MIILQEVNTEEIMTRNDILRQLRYALNLSDKELIALYKIKGYTVTENDLVNFMQKEDEPGYKEINSDILTLFLDSFIIKRRGNKDNPNQKDTNKNQKITNNIILRKIKIALELRDVDLNQIFELAGFPMSKSEISALFRSPDHRNYKLLGDQGLRNFIKGLSIYTRGSI